MTIYRAEPKVGAVMESYRKYLEEVLGVKEVLLPLADSASVDSLQILFCSAEKPSNPELMLFEKIAGAMKLQSDQYRLVNLAEPLPLPWPTVLGIVFFGEGAWTQDFLKNYSTNLPTAQVASLSAMTMNASLKKQAWESLQLIMKQINVTHL